MKPISSQRATRLGLARNHRIEQRMIGTLALREIRIVPCDHVVGELAHPVGIAARGKELEGADADVARRHAGQHRARQHGFAHHALAGDDGGERARGGDAEPEHGFADDVLAQHRSERGAAVAPARERGGARALELDVAAHAVLVDDFAEQDGPAVAELRHEMAELVAGIGHGDGIGALGQPLAGEDFSAFRGRQQVGIEPQIDGKRPVQLDQPGGGDRGRRNAREKVRGQRRVGVLEGEMQRHGVKIGAARRVFRAQNRALIRLPHPVSSGKPSRNSDPALAPDSIPPSYVFGNSMHRYRSHTCGALRESDIDQTVRLSGWCHRIRDHGGVLFIDLRDHYGLTQVVADPDSPAFKIAEKLRSEWVVRIDGKVRRRPAGTDNPELATGMVEVYVSEIEVLGPRGRAADACVRRPGIS